MILPFLSQIISTVFQVLATVSDMREAGDRTEPTESEESLRLNQSIAETSWLGGPDQIYGALCVQEEQLLFVTEATLPEGRILPISACVVAEDAEETYDLTVIVDDQTRIGCRQAYHIAPIDPDLSLEMLTTLSEVDLN